MSTSHYTGTPIRTRDVLRHPNLVAPGLAVLIGLGAEVAAFVDSKTDSFSSRSGATEQFKEGRPTTGGVGLLELSGVILVSPQGDSPALLRSDPNIPDDSAGTTNRVGAVELGEQLVVENPVVHDSRALLTDANGHVVQDRNWYGFMQDGQVVWTNGINVRTVGGEAVDSHNATPFDGSASARILE